MIVMPKGADPLANCDRYYMLMTFSPQGVGLRDVVEGRLMLRTIGTHFAKAPSPYPAWQTRSRSNAAECCPTSPTADAVS
jgi:hypothetical protein